MAVLCLLAGLLSLGAPAAVAAPHGPVPVDSVALPPWLEDRLVYYRGFEAEGGRPEVDPLPLEPVGAPGITTGGLSGMAGLTGTAERHRLVLRGPGLSPHLPLTVMFWWALEEACPANGGYGLFGLTGKGYVSVFGHGGPWCGLSDTAAVMQVYDFAGIKNVNNIYDTRIREHGGLEPRTWRHVAITFASGQVVTLYVDGRPVTRVPIEGRTFAADDELRTLALGHDSGPGLRLDEVLILQRTLAEAEVADYVTAVRRLLEVGAL